MIVPEPTAMGLAVDERIGKTSSIRLTENGSETVIHSARVNRLNGEILSAGSTNSSPNMICVPAILPKILPQNMIVRTEILISTIFEMLRFPQVVIGLYTHFNYF